MCFGNKAKKGMQIVGEYGGILNKLFREDLTEKYNT